jgi:hypothetical protein
LFFGTHLPKVEFKVIVSYNKYRKGLTSWCHGNVNCSLGVAIHICNPRYLEGRDKEDQVLMSAQAKSSVLTEKVGYDSACLSSKLLGKPNKDHNPSRPKHKIKTLYGN